MKKTKKAYLKGTSKRSYIPQKLFYNDLVAISRNKVTLNAKQTCIHWNVYFGIK